MAFVGGLMGPYMRPIPVGASAAMLFSLAAAFMVTPWAAARLLRAESAHGHAPEGAATRLYRRAMAGLIGNGRMRLAFLAGVAVLLLASVALVPLKLVTVKMLPFDNKSEFQVIVDMPEGTPLEHTARVAAELAHEVLKDASVVNVQSYVGLSSPYNFNGLVRHYFLRRGPHLADLQVNLASKDERSEQSHDIAKRVRDRLVPIARRFNATIQVAEVPPGPPVLQTLVAEVYGPDAVAPPGARRPGEIRARADARRRRRRLVRRGAAGEDVTRRRRGARKCRRRHGVARVGCRPDGDRRPHRRPPARCECARGCPDCPALAALGSGIAGRRARAAPGPEPRRRRRADARRDAHGGGQPLPQEPAARDLRDRRPGWRRRKPGLRDPAHEQRHLER